MEKCTFDLGDHECSALTKKECAGCRFYKTAGDLAKSRKKSEDRLDKINGGLHIYKKYHCGEGR